MIRQVDRSAATIESILAAARRLFATKGFEATSIDDVAELAKVAKGAIYHHFESKEAIFTRVLESVQAEIAMTQVPAAARKISDPMDRVAAGVQRYLNTAMEPRFKRILLLDGPVVIGWGKWRDIDDRYFGAMTKAVLKQGLGEHASIRDVDALAHLVAGAVMEAALVCAQSEDPLTAARDHVSVLRKMLEGARIGR
jgi:AcrR family transcriptional regulator